MSLEQQYDLVYNEIMLQRSRMKYMKYSLVCELTKNMNIHAHGIVKVSQLLSKGVAKRFLYDIFRKNCYIGFICVTNITDKSKWIEYISKDIKETKETINCRSPIMFDDLEVYNPLENI